MLGSRSIERLPARTCPTSTMRNELKILEQRWGLALQSAAFGVWDLDPVNERVLYSPEWKAMLGYGRADEHDSTAVWRSRVHPDDLQPMLDALRAYLEGRASSYEAEFRLRAADGSYRYVLSRGRIVKRDEQDRPLRMIGTLTDLTDRREAEALRLARDRAEAAHRAKAEFLSRMSHELRTPLNAVLGFAQLLSQRLGRADAEEQRRHIEHIEEAGWHLLSMIDDVLELSRVESGELQVVIGPVALAPLLEAACAAMAPKAQRRAVSIRPVAGSAGAAVLADPARLRQVLSQVLSNAVKYNRDGGSVAIDVALDEGRCRVSVSDTGIGISAEQMQHLFEPFNRLGRVNTSTDGVGVGLVLSRWLVEKMGGELRVASTEGVGTTVTLVLPAAPAAPR
ncbi:MAG TPA: PAS domain-containing sensor histidine kinase [Albitalea sp.]